MFLKSILGSFGRSFKRPNGRAFHLIKVGGGQGTHCVNGIIVLVIHGGESIQ